MGYGREHNSWIPRKHLGNAAGALEDFHKKHPWVGYRNLWAVAVMDHVAYQIINLYVVATLGAEGWLTRDDSDSGIPGKVVETSL